MDSNINRSLAEQFAASPILVMGLLLLSIFFFLLIGQGITWLLVDSWGYDLNALFAVGDATPSLEKRSLLRLIALINHLFTFILPAMLVAVFLFRSNWEQYLKMDRWPSLQLLAYGCLWILLAFPMAQGIYWLNREIPLPEWASSLEESTAGLIEAFLVMESPAELLMSLVVMALIPAIGEELVFRGLIQQSLQARVQNPHLAVWLAAAIFSTFHLQFEGFLPRMLLGGILGYLFLWSKNIWVPIAAHFINNAIQVVAAYYLGSEFINADNPEEDPINGWMVLGSTLITLAVGYYLYQRYHQQVNKGGATVVQEEELNPPTPPYSN
ncbi:MAG: CPBP family intramembrane metalloprotease [Phaeodactylibacter sp.]|nr:CPBP family intramembrane metalloprotease [Phaeodactylibacter sp.]